MTNLRENIWAVEVPEGATDFCWIGDVFACKMPDSKPGRHKWLVEADEAMANIGGEWEIVCSTKDVTEEQAAVIVEKATGGFTGRMEGYKDYAVAGCDLEPLKSASESLNSFLASKGLTGKNYCLLKKV